MGLLAFFLSLRNLNILLSTIRESLCDLHLLFRSLSHLCSGADSDTRDTRFLVLMYEAILCGGLTLRQLETTCMMVANKDRCAKVNQQSDHLKFEFQYHLYSAVIFKLLYASYVHIFYLI